MSCISGCGISQWKMPKMFTSTAADKTGATSIAHEQERRFAGALVFLRAGNEPEARDLLEQVIAGPPRRGVTDEALFRLSLLYLRDDVDKGTERSQELLERLSLEYPTSIWAHQGAPLAAYLIGVRTLRDKRREIRTLKELNLSLSRDNREMRQSIERLKILDLELDKKIKR